MEAQIKTEGSNVKGLTLDLSPAEWLIINKALMLYQVNSRTKRVDALLAMDMRETVLAELKKDALMTIAGAVSWHLQNEEDKRCAVCVETGTKWCSDCTENGGRYNYFKVR
jgi:hypothetical protein